jgi:hypothetical protein
MEGGDGADGSAGGGQGGGLTYIKRGAGAEAWEGGGECAKYKSGMGGGGGVPFLVEPCRIQFQDFLNCACSSMSPHDLSPRAYEGGAQGGFCRFGRLPFFIGAASTRFATFFFCPVCSSTGNFGMTSQYVSGWLQFNLGPL